MTQPTDTAAAENALSLLEGLSDQWSAEVNLNAMISNVLSPMDLDQSAPSDVRLDFKNRMASQIDAIVRQSFIEGSYRQHVAMSAQLTAANERADTATAEAVVLLERLKKCDGLLVRAVQTAAELKGIAISPPPTVAYESFAPLASAHLALHRRLVEGQSQLIKINSELFLKFDTASCSKSWLLQLLGRIKVRAPDLSMYIDTQVERMFPRSDGEELRLVDTGMKVNTDISQIRAGVQP